jgi:hypothetical protein
LIEFRAKSSSYFEKIGKFSNLCGIYSGDFSRNPPFPQKESIFDENIDENIFLCVISLTPV